MTEPTLAEVQPQDPTQGTGQQAEQVNAAPWADYVKDLPASVVPLVEPIFKKWDSDVTQRFQTVHSEYEPLKPYQEIISNGWDFSDVQQALNLAQTLNDNPQAVYQALIEAYGFGSEQGQSGQDAGDILEAQVDPEFARIKEMTEAMAQIITTQQEQQQAAQEDAELEQTLASLKATYGDFDDRYVMLQVHNGATWEEGIGAFQQLVAGYAQNRPAPPPVIMGSGGGLPSQVVNPASMTERDRKALVTQILAQQAQQT